MVGKFWRSVCYTALPHKKSEYRNLGNGTVLVKDHVALNKALTILNRKENDDG